MKRLDAIMGSALWYALCFASVALVIGQLTVLIWAIRDGRDRRVLLPAALNLLLGFGVFAVLMDCAYSGFVSEADAALFWPFERALFAQPWLLYAALGALSAALLIPFIRDNRRYRATHLTPEAIRLAVDMLPEGIAFSSPDGKVLLSNLRINALCRSLTGSALSDAARFGRLIHERGEEQDGKRLLRTPKGETWLVTEKRLASNGECFDQLTAVNVTERYRIIDELREKNDHLQDIQRRMKAVSALSGDMFVAREEAAARVALHNQLGQVLLMGRHYLDHPDSTDPEMVYLTTRQMTAFLLGEAAAPGQEKEDPLQCALTMAGVIGVTVDYRGPRPGNTSARSLLALAIRECAANTVKHARGNRIYVDAADAGTLFRVSVFNNGEPPEGPVAESGGLLALRRRVEAAGGSMCVQSHPVFSLTLEIPNKDSAQAGCATI